ERLQQLGSGLRQGTARSTTAWEGAARSAFDARSGPFLAAVDEGAGLLRQYADALDGLADGIEQAQAEYRQRVGLVAGTAVVGALLTVATATLSDEAAAGLVAAEVATATELAATAAEQAVAVLTALAAQAAALAARWAVMTAATVAVDSVSGMVVHRDADPLAHVHWGEDAELGLVGALAVPVGSALLAGAGGVAGGVLSQGAAGVASRLALGGASVAISDAVVREALRQGIDPGELVMAALPLGRAGRGGRVRPGVAPEGTIPRGFADAEEFVAFGRRLRGGLADAGYGDAVPVLQGSAVTGAKYTTGQPFDVGRRSDFDLAVVDPSLFARARELGVPVRRNPPRTAPLSDAQLARLGLGRLVNELSASAGREVHLMVFRDLEESLARSGGLRIR
ncbi:MAG TPA: hypothetical protein VEV65_00835, partial [Kineosporiaceae bacterium]|nr:hypothetical protein [Kineosporiaceae bacterium]